MFGYEDSDPVVVIGRALGVSVVISALMMLTTLGFTYLSAGMDLPLSAAIVLVVFAVSFIAAAVLLDKASDNLLAAFMGGAAVALSVTVFVVALASGAFFLVEVSFWDWASGMWETLLTGFAVCLIASLVINRLTLKL